MNILWILLVSIGSHFSSLASGNKPVFDVSNNMRLVLLPSDTKMGTVIYKLRASDSEEHYPLTFRAYGSDSRLISIVNVDCSMTICEADVVLAQPLDESRQKYEFNLEVSDTRGEKTVVQSEIEPTKRQGAFVGAPRIITIPETTEINTLLASFTVAENPQLFRGISCHLLPISAKRYFNLGSGLPTPISGQSRCDLRLRKKLDAEAMGSFVLQVLAENAWTDTKVDTRNVAVHEFILEVEDVADTPPYFLEAPPITRLPETAQVGDTVTMVKAFDGDYANPRPIRYHIDKDASDHEDYFEIESESGVITLRKDLKDIAARPGTPVVLRIVAEETDHDDLKNFRGFQRQKINEEKAEADIAIIIDDVINRKPRFLQDHYITNLLENAAEGTKLVFEGGLDKVEDLDKELDRMKGKCTSNEQCETKNRKKPACNKDTGKCEECGKDADCEGKTEGEKPLQACVENKKRGGEMMCALCSSNSHCRAYEDTQVCGEDNDCVQCTENSDCRGNKDGKMVCDTGNNKCVECLVGDNEPCKTDFKTAVCKKNKCYDCDDSDAYCDDNKKFTCKKNRCKEAKVKKDKKPKAEKSDNGVDISITNEHGKGLK